MKKFKLFKSGFGEKLKLLLIPIGLLIGSLTTQVWGNTATFRIVPELTWGNWWDEGTKNIRVSIQIRTYGEGDWWRTETGFEWKGLMYESGGKLYKIYECTDSNLPGDGGQKIKFMLYRGDDHEKDGILYESWATCSTINSKLYTTVWDDFSYKTWDIPAGTTVVWDAGNQESLWTTAQMYYYKSGWNSDQSSSTTDFTRLGTTQQFYHTYDGTWEGYGGLIIRQSSSWNGQTTNITTDVESPSNFVLFTHSGGGDHGSYTGGKCDWQKVSPAFKATSGATIYFDNTITGWTQPYLKYGSQWFNRSAVMSEVPGTNGKLWKYTFPNDMYYGEYMVADGYGYVNYNPIDDSHCSHYTTLQAANISSATTLIPTANAQKGATSVLDGYERTVTISSFSHGEVSVTYTDANGVAQEQTSAGNFNVQQACVITVTATADEGYRLTGLTVGGADFTSGNTYAVRDGITIAATFTPNTYSVRFNANYPDGATGTSGSMSNEAFTYGTAKALTANAFSCDHYNFAGWATSAEGAKEYDDKQSVNNLTSTHEGVYDLFAKWSEITHTVSFANDGHGTTDPDEDQTVGEVTGIAIEATPSTGYLFDTWTSSNGGTFTDASDATTTFYPAADATLTASFNAKQYDITLDDNGDYDGNGSANVKYDATALINIDAPTRSGYEVNYYARLANGNDRMADALGNLEKGLTGYLSDDGEWRYDDDLTLFAIWKPKSYILKLYKNDGTENYTSITVTMNSNSCTPAITVPTRTGYDFDGYYTSGGDIIIHKNLSKEVSDYFDASSNWLYDGNVDLYAHWTPVALSFTNEGGDGSWTNTANWSPACVPTIEHDVTINAETTINGYAVAKSVTIGSSGKVTIQPTGVLEVQGAVTNSNDSKLIINTSSSSQGALIYDISTSAPSATINMTMDYTGGSGFQYIASPVGGARVSSMFSGKGIYTYAWIEGKGWERRGYYDDFQGNEVIVINGQGSCTFSGVLCPSTGGSLSYTTSGEGFVESAQGVNMIPNTLTAPIMIAAMSFSGSADGGVHIWENGSWHGYAPASSQAATAVIPALQGYAVLASSSGSVSFNYTDAVRNASSHNDALRAPKRATEETPDYMTISVITDERKVDLQLSEHAQFTTAIDKGWETIYMEGDGRFGQLYALANEKMSILATPDLEGTVLGFVPGETLNYTLTFEGDGKGYYLNDIEEQLSTLIEEGNTYTFSAGNNDAARFIVSRTPISKTTTGNEAIYDGVKARKQMIDGVLYIIKDGRMYNAEGMIVK